MPLRERLVLCELRFGLWRGTLFTQGEREREVFCRERNGGVSSEGGEEREDVGAWER